MLSAVLNPTVSAMSWFMDVTDDDGALVAKDPWYRWRLLSNLAAFKPRSIQWCKSVPRDRGDALPNRPGLGLILSDHARASTTDSVEFGRSRARCLGGRNAYGRRRLPFSDRRARF